MLSRLSIPVPHRLFVYGLATLLCLAILVKYFGLQQKSLTMPLAYNGDALVHMGWIKNIVETGWYLHNDRVGAPGGQDVRGFPGADTLHHATFALLAVFTHDVFVLYNLFYLLTFPLTTLTTLFVLRRLNVSASIAVGVSLLYTFLPYHYFRMGHLFLSAYYLVPVIGLFALRLYQGQPFLMHDADVRGWLKRDWFAAALACMLFGFGGAYYAFFACYFFLVAGIAGALRRCSWAPLLRALGAIAGVFACFLIAVLPTLLQRYSEGTNADDTMRAPSESELYGLKVIQMLIPIQDHYVPQLTYVAKQYNLFAPLVTENRFASLGLIGSVGLLVLLGRALVQYRSSKRGSPLDGLALLCVASIFLGTVGGLGASFAYFFSTWIRAYNRISICVGFFALTAAALLLESARQRWFTTSARRYVFMSILAVLFCGGMVDLTPSHRLSRYPIDQIAFASDRDYVQAIERYLPAGRIVCQLPIRPYPEANHEPPGIEFYAYDHLRLQLHSNSAHWTYGSLRGHEGDVWCRRLDKMSLDQQLLTLIRADVGGISIDTSAYGDHAASLIAELTEYLGPPAITSTDERLVFFDLREMVEHEKARCGEASWFSLHDSALHPVLLYWRQGFFEEEASPQGGFRWAAGDAELIISNRGVLPKRVRLEFCFDRPPECSTHPLRIECAFFTTDVLVGMEETHVQQVIDVPPGEHRVKFTTHAKPQVRGSDIKHRPVVYRVFRIECSEALSPEEDENLCKDVARLRRTSP